MSLLSTIRFTSPAMPHYIVSGEDTYTSGISHAARKDIGVFDLIVVTRGCLFLMEEETPYAVSAGHTLMLRPDRAHQASNSCSEETHFYWLHFQTLGLWEEVITDPGRLVHPIADSPYMQVNQFSIYLQRFQKLSSPHEIYKRMSELHVLDSGPLATDRWKQQILFQELLLELQEGVPTAADIPHIRVAEQAAAYLRQHFREPVSYAAIADVIHFHPNYIARCMKRVFGCTPLEFITRCRIEQAKLLLTHTDDPISAVAEQSGFGSFPFFVRCFTKHTGQRPREYRMQFRS